MKKYISILLAVTMLFALAIPAYATPAMTLNEAKEYLLNYSIRETNSQGKECITHYEFQSEEDLNAVAQYIVEYGIVAFNNALNNKIAEVKRNEKKVPNTRAVTNPIIERTISGNGNHNIYGISAGFCEFEDVNDVEYSVEMSYTVQVSNGAITGMSEPVVRFEYVSLPGSVKSYEVTDYYNATHCGATVNFVIESRYVFTFGDGEVTIVSETDNEVFAILTALQ